jgi:DNA-binding response OmpR family regulator
LAKPIRAHRVLVVEDHDSLRLFISAALSRNGFRVLQARSERDVQEILDRSTVGAMFVDLDSPSLDGAAVLAAYRDRYGPRAPLVACPPLDPHGEDLSTAVFVRKPISIGRLVDAFHQSLTTADGRSIAHGRAA